MQAQPVGLGLGLAADPLRLLGRGAGGGPRILRGLVQYVLGRAGGLRQLGGRVLGRRRAGLLRGLRAQPLDAGAGVGEDLLGLGLEDLGLLGGLADQPGHLLLGRAGALLVDGLRRGELPGGALLGVREELLGLGARGAQGAVGLLDPLLGHPAEVEGLLPGLLGLGGGARTQPLGVLGGLLGLRGGGGQQPLGLLAGAQQGGFGLRTGGLGVGGQPAPGLLGDACGLGAGGVQGLLGLGAGLVHEPAGLGLRTGAQLLGPGHVLVDVRLDGLAALVELLVQALAAVDGLGVQLCLQARLVLGVLLQDALGLRPGVTQLALGVRAHLVGLDLGIAEQLLRLVAHVRTVVSGAGRQIAAYLVELGAQHLDLVSEVFGVLDGLPALLLQPLHLGFEAREMVGFSLMALLAFVAPHSAVPSVPWSQAHSQLSIARPLNDAPGGMVSDTGAGVTGPDPVSAPNPGRAMATLPAGESGHQWSINGRGWR